jgi:hypothetical protein
MSTTKKPIRKSISVPPTVANRVRSLARAQRTSENRVLVELIETGLAAKDDERRQFQDLVDQLARAKTKAEQKRLKEELARLTFGD